MHSQKIKVTPQIFLDLSLLCYMCCSVVRLVFYLLTGFDEFSYIITYITIYVFLASYLIWAKRWFTRASIIIFVCLIVFLALTCIQHPEYRTIFFGRSNAWNVDRIITHQVFAAASGFTILPIICLYRKFEDYMRIMTIVSLINALFIIFLYLSGNFTYTQSTITSNDTYSGSMGYDSLIPLFFFVYNVLNQSNVVKRTFYIVLVFIMFWMVLTSGVRGALLCVIIFCFMFLMLGINYKFKTIAKIGITTAAATLGYMCLYSSLLVKLGVFLSGIGISSRTIHAMAGGILSDDNGRNALQLRALSLISDAGPFGLGFCSSRYYYNGGYPHNIFLEVWIDMGYVAGTMLIILLILGVIYFFVKVSDYDWRFAFIALFSCALGKLFVSSSLWSETFFWETIAIGLAALSSCHSEKGRTIKRSLFYHYKI